MRFALLLLCAVGAGKFMEGVAVIVKGFSFRFSGLVLGLLGLISMNSMGVTASVNDAKSLGGFGHSPLLKAPADSNSSARPEAGCSSAVDSQKLVEKYYKQNMLLIDRLLKLSLASIKAKNGEGDFKGKSADEKSKLLTEMAGKEYKEALSAQAPLDKYVHGNSFSYIANRAALDSLSSDGKKAPLLDSVVADLTKLRNHRADVPPSYLTPSRASAFDAKLDNLIRFAQTEQTKEKAGDKTALKSTLLAIKSAEKDLASSSGAPARTASSAMEQASALTYR
jgi:hypothetical protein